MKTKSFLTSLAFALAALFCAAGRPALACVCFLAVCAAWLQPRPMLGTATLIVPILTGKVFEAFKKQTVGLDFFSTDFGKAANGFAQPVKFGQDIISQLAVVPNAYRSTPGGLLGTSQSSTGLVTDLHVGIDRMAAVKVRLPSADITQLLAMPAFLSALAEAGMGLGRFVVQDAISEGISGRNFTNTITAANPDLDTLENGRVALNNQAALQPRFGLGSTTFLSKIGGDPRILYTYGYNQKIGGDAYAQFDNIKGFSTVRELASFPTGNRVLATFTANAGTDTCTITALAAGVDATTGNAASLDPLYDIYNGARVQVTATGAIPGGLAALTNYFVINYTLDNANGVVGGSGVNCTFQLSATIGGAAIDITDAGAGTLTISQDENCQGLLFEKRGIHIATRPMIDPTEAAGMFGIPNTILVQRETDPLTGLDFLVFIWQDTNGASPSLDVFATFVVQYGIKAGRGIQTLKGDPTSFAANTGMDRCGLRVLTA